jgi:nucleoside-diphosphate-sugar epimerase
MIVNMLLGRALPIYGDGRNVRDWPHVGDYCRGIDPILSHGVLGKTYNIGGGSEVENIELVHLLCDLAREAFNEQPELSSMFPQCPAARGESAPRRCGTCWFERRSSSVEQPIAILAATFSAAINVATFLLGDSILVRLFKKSVSSQQI